MKTWFFKIANLVLVLLFIARPDTVLLGLFLDSVGFELFLLLITVQVKSVFFYVYLNYLKPALREVARVIEKGDDFCIFPSWQVIKAQPCMLTHGVPGFALCLRSQWLLKSNPYG
jgi:hypothetical protein